MTRLRRIVSVLFYLLAGTFLTGLMTLALASPDGETGKLEMMATAAAFALLPLALGILASPGRRVREAGIVLLIAGGWMAITGAMFAYMALAPDVRAQLPPETLASLSTFRDYPSGIAVTFGTIALGALMLLKGPKPPRDPAEPFN